MGAGYDLSVAYVMLQVSANSGPRDEELLVHLWKERGGAGVREGDDE